MTTLETVSREDHEQHVARMRQDDATEDPVESRTMSGPEAVEAAFRPLEAGFNRLSAEPTVPRHIVEGFRQRMDDLKRRAGETQEYSVLFILAGDAHNLCRSVLAALPENDPAAL
jgi:hypothetical protein